MTERTGDELALLTVAEAASLLRVREQAPDVMSIRQLARYLRVHFYTARRLVESREIPARKIGASWRVTRRVADAYLEASR